MCQNGPCGPIWATWPISWASHWASRVILNQAKHISSMMMIWPCLYISLWIKGPGGGVIPPPPPPRISAWKPDYGKGATVYNDEILAIIQIQVPWWEHPTHPWPHSSWAAWIHGWVPRCRCHLHRKTSPQVLLLGWTRFLVNPRRPPSLIRPLVTFIMLQGREESTWVAKQNISSL